jgi:hypothetical protein
MKNVFLMITVEKQKLAFRKKKTPTNLAKYRFYKNI